MVLLDDLLLSVEDTGLLQHLSNDRDGRVDGVRDHEDERIRAEVGDALCKPSDNASIDLRHRISPGNQIEESEQCSL